MFRKCMNAISCCCPGKRDTRDFYAQYGVSANPASGERLPFFAVFEEGNRIRLSDERTILLPAGYLYQIDYVFLATTEENSYMQILPRLNDRPGLLYSVFAPSGAFRNTSASAGFTTDAAVSTDALLDFILTYPGQVRNIDISGAVSITPVISR